MRCTVCIFACLACIGSGRRVENAALQARRSQDTLKLADAVHTQRVKKARPDLRNALALLLASTNPLAGFTRLVPGDQSPALIHSRFRVASHCSTAMSGPKTTKRRLRRLRAKAKAERRLKEAGAAGSKKTWRDYVDWDTPVSLHKDMLKPPRYLCVLDFEATCENTRFPYNHEIIEFPVVLVDLQNRSIVSEFHSYVRPSVNTTLSKFCLDLTGISQDQVDRSPTLPEVLKMFDEWRISNGLEHSAEGQNFIFVTHGPDLRDFLYKECVYKGIQQATYFNEWSNIKRVCRDHWKLGVKIHMSINDMLKRLKLQFEGQPHSGIDDTRNIARVALHLHGRGAKFYRNEELKPYHLRALENATKEPEDAPALSPTNSAKEPEDAPVLSPVR